MTYRLTCNGCGGSVTANAAAIRRELAVCSECNAILKVADAGFQQEREAILHRAAPETVTIQLHSPRNISIRARRHPSAWTLNRRTSFFAWAGGLGAAATLAASLGPGFSLLGIVAGFACFAIAAKLQRQHAPLELRGGHLIPSIKSHAPLPVADVQQIYAALCHVGLGGDTSYSTANVFALTHKGERVLLLGPLQSEEDALYIEQVLESGLQLFDLPGSTEWATRGDEPCEANKGRIEAQRCEGCDAKFSREDAGNAQLYECLRCGALSLLLTAEEEQDFLRDSGSEPASFEIAEEVDGLSIEALEAGQGRGSIEVLDDRVVLRQTGSAPLTISGRDLESIFVKATQCSEEADNDSFRVMARRDRQGELELLRAVPEAREAFRIARTLKRILAKSA